MRSSHGFTLLEIIIAISLIAIFITLPILAYSGYLKKTRDTQRKNSINQIQSALEQYRANNGKYPPENTWKDVLVAQGYLPSIPTDPFDGQEVDGETGVFYGFDYTTSADGQSYQLSARMEENQPGGTGAANEKSYYTVGPEGPRVVHITPGGAGGGGSGSGSLAAGNLTGTFNGTGAGLAGGSVTLNGTVTGGTFTGTFNGDVTGGANGTVTGNYSGSTTGTISGSATATCPLTSGSVAGTVFTGSIDPCTLTPGSSGGLATNTPIPTNTGIATSTPRPTSTYTPTPTPLRSDLTVETIARDNTNYTVTYCNRGPVTASGTYTLYFERVSSPHPIGAAWERYDNLTVPAVNTCATQTIPFCFSNELSGGYNGCSDAITVRATVDKFNQIAENNKTNNILDQAFAGYTPTPTPPMPDLTIEGLVRSTNKYDITYCNRGLVSAAGTFYMSISLQGNGTWAGYGGGNNASGFTVPAANSCTVGSVPCYSDVCAWSADVTATVDSGDVYGQTAITESNENNNTYTASFVAATPTLSPTPGANLVATWGSTQGTGNGQFAYPHDVATDSSNNVYVLDAYNYRVQKLTNTGTFITKWGACCTGNGNFTAPAGIIVDSTNGWVYVSDGWNNNVQKFSLTGTYISTIGSSGSGNGQFNGPAGLALDSANNLYVAEDSNNRIQKFNTAGTYLATFSAPRPMYDVSVDSSGNVFGVDYNWFRIRKYNSATVYQTEWAVGGVPQFSDWKGTSLYVSNRGLIEKYSAAGALLSSWGADTGSSGMGVAADNLGNVFVADTWNHHILKYTLR